MRKSIKRTIRSVARSFGIDVIRHERYANQLAVASRSLLAMRDALPKVEHADDRTLLEKCCHNITRSKAQLFQDIFVLHRLEEKRDGFFVEFGSTNGVDLSNTHLLEKEFGWNGILAEPARCWRDALQTNRQCSLDFRCVWSASGETLQFVETSDAELSTVVPFMDRQDANSQNRLTSAEYNVETISLSDLLRAHNAPERIDYLSVDTEGSEYKIMSSFDFDEYDVRIITIEHNYIEPDRSQIHRLLALKGYLRVSEVLSQWDDWYVRHP